jgi:hypothetical protein
MVKHNNQLPNNHFVRQRSGLLGHGDDNWEGKC